MRKYWIAMALALVLAFLPSASAESASVMLEKGIYCEETTGDLDAAIAVYKQILAEAEANRQYLAEAQYRLGVCYEKKGEKETATEAFRNVVSRYADQAEVVAKAQLRLASLPQKSEWVKLGEVVLRVVNDDNIGDDSMLDFETGRLFSLTSEARTRDDERIAWLAGKGIDFAGETSGGSMGGIGICLGVMPLDPAWWDRDVSVESLNDMGLKDVANLLTAPIAGIGPLPATYAFRTREGSVGILQILGVTEEARGVKLRYRMVHCAGLMKRMRYFVLIVVGKDAMTFEGQETTWEELPPLLEKVPNRRQTVLAVAVASNDMTLKEANEAQSRALGLALSFGFEYLSYVGVHPLGAKGGPPQEVEVISSGTGAGAAESAPAATRKVLLPDVDKSQVMLDLASGWLVALPEVDNEDEVPAAIDRLGRGDLVYDECGMGAMLAFVRGARSDRELPVLEYTPDAPITYDILSPPWPYTFAVTTREGESYKVRVLKADKKGCELEYGLIAAAHEIQEAPHFRCRAQLKHLGLAVHIYATDHAEQFPPGPTAAAVFSELLSSPLPNASYLSGASEKLFICPGAKQDMESWEKLGKLTDETCSYEWVAGLDANSSPDFILAYDKSPDHHGGRRNVLRVDGRVEEMTEERFQETMAEQRVKMEVGR